MPQSFSLCIVIPCYNHGKELSGYLPSIVAYGIPVIVVDDGSSDAEAALISTAVEKAGASLLRLPDNRGKWGALTIGMMEAAASGYTHVLQCDADGQHDPLAIPQFEANARKSPTHLILGQPKYGEDAPTARRKGRQITNFFVWLETAGACKADAMCGFRLYPLERILKILKRRPVEPGMGGDIELLVRCYWDGMPVTTQDVHVCYPEGGRSNFRMLRDNLIISWTHTKLCTAALLHPWRLVKAHRPR